MPFLGAALPFLKVAGPAIGSFLGKFLKSRGGAGLLGSGLGGWLSSRFAKPSDQANQAMKSIMDISGTAQQQAGAMGEKIPSLFDTFGESVPRARWHINRGRERLDRAEKLGVGAEQGFDRAEASLDPFMQWSRDLVGGGPEAMFAMAPEIGATQGQYENIRKSLDAFAPRGGGRANTLANLPLMQQRDVTNLLSQARRFGAQLGLQGSSLMGQFAQGRTGLMQSQGQLAQIQNFMAANEADIGRIAGQMGISLSQLQDSLLRTAMYGPQSILDYDIRNRMMTLPMMQAGAKAGGNIAGTIWDVISGMGKGGGGGPSPDIMDIPNVPGGGGRNPLLDYPEILWPQLP